MNPSSSRDNFFDATNDYEAVFMDFCIGGIPYNIKIDYDSDTDTIPAMEDEEDVMVILDSEGQTMLSPIRNS